MVWLIKMTFVTENLVSNYIRYPVIFSTPLPAELAMMNIKPSHAWLPLLTATFANVALQ